ncbi:hypothetical protein M4D79_14885 [Mycolicibacterium novocastrense]|nr:hypothetical protein M4D79_14885 [Mycolicibacterium novocastrense]
MSVDVRTRVDGEPALIEPAEFFETTLPRLFVDSNERLAPSLQQRAPRPLTVSVDDQRWTLGVDGRRMACVRGAATGTELRIDAEQLAALVSDQVTPMGWLTTGTLQIAGQLSDVLDWWLFLRAALDGTTPHVNGAVVFKDRDGEQLDLKRCYAPDDPADEMAWFLEQAGYLHIKGRVQPIGDGRRLDRNGSCRTALLRRRRAFVVGHPRGREQRAGPDAGVRHGISNSR